MTLVIKSGVPIPGETDRRKNGQRGEYAETFRSMKVGDMVEFPNMTPKQINSPRVCAIYIQNATGFKFTTRKFKDGYGIWRIA